MNKNKYSPVCLRFQQNGKTIDNGKDIANRFNNFFVNVGTNLAAKIPKSNKKASDYLINCNKNNNVFYTTMVTEEEVLKIISNFKDSSAGHDDIKPNIIKHVKNTIKKPLAHISNLSFNTGIFPDELKKANVIPIYSAKNEMEFSNYRPVSVLPVFSKLLERLMYKYRLLMHSIKWRRFAKFFCYLKHVGYLTVLENFKHNSISTYLTEL